MLPFKNFIKFRMLAPNISCILFSALVLLVLFNVSFAESKSPHTLARVLARQTGATQFEEERYEPHTDCHDHKHHLKKRASDEDVDYEVYQGVVGRPGIDFPIYPRIPRTSFSCRSFGNGYFADMETDCQVFHICEEGRKISFLCPNGTIFQQSELTCDWWFKVNCLGSSGYYAESSEILHKQRVQRIRPSVPVKGFNIVGGGSLNPKPKATVSSIKPRKQPSSKQSHNKSERRMDSNEEAALESVDFDDVSGEKQLKGQKNKVLSNIESNNNDETQIAAESASFVGGNRRNSYNSATERKPSESRISGIASRRQVSSQRRPQNNNNNNNSNGNNESTERARHGQRGQQRYTKDDEKKPLVESFEINSSGERTTPKKPFLLPERTVKPVIPVEVQPKSNIGSSILAVDTNDKSERIEAPTARTVEKIATTTPYYPSGTYSTARRLDTTRSTPFYTPTVPTVNKSKPTEGKSHYIKGKGNVGAVATTPNPNRFNVGPGIFLESSAAPKVTPTTAKIDSSTLITTLRPIVIGMRNNHETTPETHRFSIAGQNFFNTDLPTVSDAPEQKVSKYMGGSEYLPTTTPAPTGPTYLPKSQIAPKAVSDGAGGDALLFAPIPTASDATVSRNVNEMIKAINYIKDKLEDVEDFRGTPRAGLEIPPSSGPDALVSLAQYFATEHNDSTGQSLNGLDNEKSGKTHIPTTTAKNTVLQVTSIPRLSPQPPAKKPSDTTSGITTTFSPNISSNADDIKASLLSEKTVTKYSTLFGLKEAMAKEAGKLSDGLLSPAYDDTGAGADKQQPFDPFPQIGSTDATISQLADKPDSRKIAQVFSNALTTYLENPQTFREKLEAVRPTEPPVGGKVNFIPVTDPTLFNGGTAASYLPTRPTPAIKSYSTTTPTSIAAEINNKFDYSTHVSDVVGTTEVFDSTTFRPARDSLEQKLSLEFSDEILPPGQDSGEGDELLQRENSQSFVNARNNLSTHQNKDTQRSQGEKAPTTPKPTENPWNHASQTDFLDPLTINDGLMKESKTTTTIPPYTFSYDRPTTTPSIISDRGRINVLSSDSHRVLPKYTGSAEVTTKQSTPAYRSQEITDSWTDIFSSYDIPRETLPSNSGLQRIANKLFGGLNESEALHLKNVMAQAEHNRQVLSLLLLLIQTCDDHNGKALERSRKHLLNALIDMDSKIQNDGAKSSYQKASSTTISSVPVTKGGTGSDSTAAFSTTPELELLSTTIDPQPTTATSSSSGSSVEETTKFEIHVEDLDEQATSASVIAPPTNIIASDKNADKRALELLKSLYSLASKFTSRR